MERRKFVYTSLAAGTLPFVGAAAVNSGGENQSTKELYELRTYEVKFRANRRMLEDYLRNVLQPGLLAEGVNHFLLFRESGMEDPARIWVLISYPTADIYLRAQNLHTNPNFTEAVQAYDQIPPEQALYNRYSSWLLWAFDGLPQMIGKKENNTVFELRTYEGYSEDAVRRKIKMFNEGEIDIFHKTGLDPVFFGEMLAGPYRPSLTYMLQFRDMGERDANWGKFGSHPDWKKMSGMEEYANTVSNIRRKFLEPL
jgi:hypothetical protein